MKENKVKYISLAIFSILTFVLMFTRAPFWDEARAFMVSMCSIKEIFQLIRIDGHPIVWYLILKPFSNIKFYPYPMLFLNWIFCIFALKVFWDKAPFKIIHKIFITFSNIFLFYFAIVSRGYCYVLILLFWICALYPKRFKNPYLFSFLIVFCANSELVGAIFCFYLGLTFLYELFKKKKKALFLKTFSIYFLGALLFLLQIVNTKDYNLANIYQKPSLMYVLSYIHFSNLRTLYFILFSIFVLWFSFYVFKKNKKLFLVFLAPILTYASVFLFIYVGSFWNYHFFYIYLILSCWLGYKYLKKNKFLYAFFILLLVFNLPINRSYRYNSVNMIYFSNSYNIAKVILENPKYKNAKLYALDYWSDVSPGADLYLLKQGIELYHTDGTKKNSFENIKNIYTYKDEKIDLEKLYSTFDKNKENYLLINRKDTFDKIFSSKEFEILLVEYFKKANLKIYKVRKK